MKRRVKGRAVADPREYPDLAFDEAWGRSVFVARTAAGLTQKELGRRCGVSQNIVSMIENYELKSSRAVLPICKALKIPPPSYSEDPDEKKWNELGRRFRTEKSRKRYKALVAFAEQMLEADDDNEVN